MLPNRAKAGSIFETGLDIGIAALQIVRGGILVEEGPQQHAWAVQRTQELTANPAIRAIFEAFAFRPHSDPRRTNGRGRLYGLSRTMPL